MSTGRKSLLKKQIITNGDMSQATLTSLVTDIQFLDNICVELVFTGSPTGFFYVQGSVDYTQDGYGNVTNAGNWVSLNLYPAPVAPGGDDLILIDMNQLSFAWVRVLYQKASGTGTLNAFIGGKGL